ncbi:MAG: polysaccharide deacetylase family sporulation protein PdaB [Syntrophomonadaceae bacterium]|jgi:polysaccharide deacetylase family sporulation protein PdaB|nr:polysaccharide deacetylase family sporulation protein PdaB [Syntrophomonadaceae bacterium]
MANFIGFYHPKKYYRPILVCIITLALIGSGVLYVKASSKLKPIYEINTKEKKIALTFDISWGNNTPAPVLDILKANNIRCTFFLSGPWVKQYPEIVKRIQEDGHEIGSHGYRHINLSTLSQAEVGEEIQKAHNSIKEVAGLEAGLIRTPNGDYNDTVIKAIQENHYTGIQWSLDSLDWMNPGVKNIIERVSARCKPGDIILMHASDTCKQTDLALPDILNALKEKGFEFVTVSELLQL